MGDPRETDFSEFVRSRTPALLRTAYLLTGDRHLAEDLVQKALTRTQQTVTIGTGAGVDDHCPVGPSTLLAAGSGTRASTTRS
jgi:hypothetical protein